MLKSGYGSFITVEDRHILARPGQGNADRLIPDITATFGEDRFAYDVSIMDPCVPSNVVAGHTCEYVAARKIEKYEAAAQERSITFVPLCAEIYGRFSGLFWNEVRRISHYVEVQQSVAANVWYSYWRKRLQFRLAIQSYGLPTSVR